MTTMGILKRIHLMRRYSAHLFSFLPHFPLSWFPYARLTVHLGFACSPPRELGPMVRFVHLMCVCGPPRLPAVSTTLPRGPFPSKTPQVQCMFFLFFAPLTSIKRSFFFQRRPVTVHEFFFPIPPLFPFPPPTSLSRSIALMVITCRCAFLEISPFRQPSTGHHNQGKLGLRGRLGLSFFNMSKI